jgi:hypothetical protein
VLTDEQLLNPAEAELDSESREYRLEMIRTLAHCFQINANANTQLRAMITTRTRDLFAAEMARLTIPQLEDRIAAVQVQNPGLLLEAMKAAGHNIKRDALGNIEIGEPTNLAGRYVTAEEFEA